MNLYIQTILGLIIFLTGINSVLFSQITDKEQKAAEKLFGLEFDDKEREMMKKGLEGQLKNYKDMREVSLPNSVVPAVGFQPLPPGFQNPGTQRQIRWKEIKAKIPENREELAFYSVGELSYLIKNQQVTSLELTEMYLDRLKRYGDTL